jgi:hypothetical protein
MAVFARGLVLVSLLLAACSDDGAGGAGGTGATGGGGTAGAGASGGGGEAGATTNGGGGSGVGGAGGGGGAGGSSAFAQLCAYRSANCGVDEAACLSQESCAKEFLRDEVEASLFACLTQDCNEDACLAATAMVPLSTLGTEVQGDCGATLQNCKGNFMGADTCEAPFYLADPLLTEIATCLALGCFEIDTCVGMVFDPLDACEDWI